MDGIYTGLVRTTLIAGLVLAAVTLWAAIAFEAMSLLPTVALAVASVAYAKWRLDRTKAERA